ncbi:hypothetical protein NOVO_00395 [Rickettsiales bacterium Ac37b]|nr:hypothetical protein NOVO_00395 [Rickettsiales bacterium Ac37b]
MKNSNNKFFDPFSKEDISLLMQVGTILKQNGMKMTDFGDYLQSYSKEKLRSEQAKLGKQNAQSVGSPEDKGVISEEVGVSRKSAELERYSEAKKSVDISTARSKVDTISQTKAKSSKDLVLTMSSSFQQTSAQIDALLKSSNHNLSKEELSALSELNISIKKLNQDLDELAQKSEMKIQQELEGTRQLKEHEEKRKGFMDRIKEGGKEIADTLASLLLPEAWYEKAKERENELSAQAKGEHKQIKESKQEVKNEKLSEEKDNNKENEVKEAKRNEINPQTKQEVESIIKSLREQQQIGQITPSVPITKDQEKKRNENFSQEIIPSKTKN